MYKITIVEPDIEQVIIKNISSDFNLFKMLQTAKKISKNRYETQIKDTKYQIYTTDNLTISHIDYTDELDNNISIVFSHQKTNQKIDNELFIPTYPLNYDIVSH